jgi:hypothetical protein
VLFQNLALICRLATGIQKGLTHKLVEFLSLIRIENTEDLRGSLCPRFSYLVGKSFASFFAHPF